MTYADHLEDLGSLHSALRRLEAYVAKLGGDPASAPQYSSLYLRELAQLKRLDDAEVLLDLARSGDDAEALAEVGSEIADMTRSILAWGLRTAFAVVEVIPAAEQTDTIEIRDEDIRVDFYRTRGPSCGGPVLGRDGARITHLPTGAVVSAGSSEKLKGGFPELRGHPSRADRCRRGVRAELQDALLASS